MPLGNLTSQFFANVYLNELDYFIKHELKAKFYIRYVDDFVILHRSKEVLESWKDQIDSFLINELRLELHPDKTKIIPIPAKTSEMSLRSQITFGYLQISWHTVSWFSSILLSQTSQEK